MWLATDRFMRFCVVMTQRISSWNISGSLNLLLTNAHPVSLGKGNLVLLEIFGIWAKPAIGVKVASVWSPNTDVGVYCVRRHGNDRLLRAYTYLEICESAAERRRLRCGGQDAKTAMAGRGGKTYAGWNDLSIYNEWSASSWHYSRQATWSRRGESKAFLDSCRLEEIHVSRSSDSQNYTT